jgi:hypothetical protein
MKHLAPLCIFLCLLNPLFGQEAKQVEALRIQNPISIDGVLDEAVYSQIKPATDFVQLQPHNGQASFQPTKAWFFYDETAIYVGAMLYDSAPDSIFNFLSERDNIGMSDYFGVYIDPYNQGQLAYGFFLTPAGVQTDIKAIKMDYDHEDSNWNAVWESQTNITKEGWIIEMRIPYSALRFSDKTTGDWGMNMFRNIRRYNSNNSWSLIDRNISGFIHQQGQLSGIKDVKPPVRLSLSPYLATYYETKTDDTDPCFLLKGGMDIKYGISDSYTLDMMLIPDFGQIQSDDKKLNLSPFELYYDEKRQFFTEGTELFQRGEIFYSRRIGAAPKFSANDFLADNEEVHLNPSETQLVNATKVSGRGSKGLAVGVLNAMSLSSYAELKDTLTGAIRDVVVQPFTNYNVTVVDQSLKNNSYFSLINTNVSMANHPFSANVTATEFQLRNKAKTFAINGKGGVSNRSDDEGETGFFTKLGIEKNKGKWQYGTTQTIYSDDFNPGDLGYLQSNNKIVSESYIYYQHIEPNGLFREYNGNIWWDHVRMYKPSTLSGNMFGGNANLTFKNNYYINFNGGYATETYDYREPRVEGRYYTEAPNYWLNYNFTTDRRKKLSFYLYFGHGSHSNTSQNWKSAKISADWRLGQKFSMNYTLDFQNEYNQFGYVNKSDDESVITFAQRDVFTRQNILSMGYVLNNKASIKLRARHYWSGCENKAFFQLQEDGSLRSDQQYSENEDQNYNAFTVDMSFRWIFAPGSELIAAWKNAAYHDCDAFMRNYGKNLQQTWSDQTNTLSLKVLYYIDYNNLRRKKG